jgi:hypothetical protein
LEENAMKRNVLYPFLFVALLVLAVGLACGIDLGTKTSEPPQPIIQPTSAPIQPTSAPIQQPTQQELVQPTEVPPTVAPSNPFFKEEFNTDVLSSWTPFIITGDTNSDKSKSSLTIENGKLIFKLEDVQLYSYLIFDGHTYEDVRVEVSADNRGKNTNNISLLCRYSDAGWYEFSVMSSGLFQIWAYDATGAVHKGYNLINSGGSNAIKMGKETNVYSITCSGNHLTLNINGKEAASFTEKKYGFNDGKVGVNVSSLDVYPVIVEFDYFDIQQP